MTNISVPYTSIFYKQNLAQHNIIALRKQLPVVEMPLREPQSKLQILKLFRFSGKIWWKFRLETQKSRNELV